MVNVLGVSARAEEVSAALPGDDIVPDAVVVMNRGFTLPATPDRVWPWIAQLGRNRSGWYLPRWVEAVLPRGRRALRHVDDSLQHLSPGDVIDDWPGRDDTFEIVVHRAPDLVVHRSTRGDLRISWVIALRAEGPATRVHLRLRLGGVRRKLLVETAGELVDLLTVAGLAAGLRERVAP
ncbi:hypothetical protein [Umezawaea sp. NPDC059074]|uniref:hypothetical protein n=1 Tax=Umezawaea sp. NPDC059074 TaxID=3346716 RepID=UPI0036B9BAF3